ncbi:MAG: DUF1330 domain-containing protein [Bacteroidota bacterium]
MKKENTYIQAKPEAGKRFFQKFQNKGKVCMLNLLKFKNKAEYDQEEFEKDMSGKEAYQMYMNNVRPELISIGSKLIFLGYCSEFLIGPEHEKWDAVLLVEYPSVNEFLAFSQSKSYLDNVKHRNAALADSRLLPIKKNQDLL